jgi:hypothetical protein
MGSASAKNQIVFLSVFFSACGALEMPDAGTKPTSANGGTVAASQETEFDLSKCGFDLSKPDATIATQRLTMVPISKQITTGIIFQTTVDVKVTGASINEDSLSRRTGSFSVQATPQIQDPQIADLISKYTSGFSADLMPLAERAKIGTTQPEWKGIFCTFQPAMKIQRGSTERVLIDLSRPLPVSPLLTADLARLKTEMGVKRSWTGITAKVTESTDPSVSSGSMWTGRVDSTPVTPAVTVTTPNGKKIVQSEMAVKITYDFGSPEANRALGLPKSVTWYIDSGTRSFKATAVDFGDDQPIYYLPAL